MICRVDTVGTLLLAALLWGVCLPSAWAQQTRTFTIRDGTIYVDGQQLSSDQIPDRLDLQGVTARYRFVGVQRPVIELDGRLYAIENGLTPVSEDEVKAEGSSVVLQEIASQRSSPNDRAAEDQGTQPVAGAQKQYLNDVQQANRELYEQLVRERSMEERARELARVIRLLPEDGDERAAKIDTLQGLLHDIFDLKQENRRREIERLQREIKELQRRLQRRRQMREQMIGRRLDQLIGSATER